VKKESSPLVIFFGLAWYWIGSAVESALRHMREIYG
jgi:hypothetical protein